MSDATEAFNKLVQDRTLRREDWGAFVAGWMAQHKRLRSDSPVSGQDVWWMDVGGIIGKTGDFERENFPDARPFVFVDDPPASTGGERDRYDAGYAKGLEDAGVMKDDIRAWLTGPLRGKHVEVVEGRQNENGEWEASILADEPVDPGDYTLRLRDASGTGGEPQSHAVIEGLDLAVPVKYHEDPAGSDSPVREEWETRWFVVNQAGTFTFAPTKESAEAWLAGGRGSITEIRQRVPEHIRPASTGGEQGSGWSNLRMTSEADGERDEPLEGGWAIERGVTCVVCPDCAFVFAAEHESEPNGGYSCPACAELRLEAEREGAVPVEVGQIVEHPKKKTVLLTMDRYADVESYTDAYLIPRNRDGGDDA